MVGVSSNENLNQPVIDDGDRLSVVENDKSIIAATSAVCFVPEKKAYVYAQNIEQAVKSATIIQKYARRYLVKKSYYGCRGCGSLTHRRTKCPDGFLGLNCSNCSSLGFCGLGHRKIVCRRIIGDIGDVIDKRRMAKLKRLEAEKENNGIMGNNINGGNHASKKKRKIKQRKPKIDQNNYRLPLTVGSNNSKNILHQRQKTLGDHSLDKKLASGGGHHNNNKSYAKTGNNSNNNIVGGNDQQHKKHGNSGGGSRRNDSTGTSTLYDGFYSRNNNNNNNNMNYSSSTTSLSGKSMTDFRSYHSASSSPRKMNGNGQCIRNNSFDANMDDEFDEILNNLSLNQLVISSKPDDPLSPSHQPNNISSSFLINSNSVIGNDLLPSTKANSNNNGSSSTYSPNSSSQDLHFNNNQSSLPSLLKVNPDAHRKQKLFYGKHSSTPHSPTNMGNNDFPAFDSGMYLSSPQLVQSQNRLPFNNYHEFEQQRHDGNNNNNNNPAIHLQQYKQSPSNPSGQSIQSNLMSPAVQQQPSTSQQYYNNSQSMSQLNSNHNFLSAPPNRGITGNSNDASDNDQDSNGDNSYQRSISQPINVWFQ